MNEQEMANSLINNFSIGDIVAVLSMIGAIIAAIFAWVSKRKAATSEKQAAQYAKNADEAHIAAKEYFNSMNAQILKSNETKEALEENQKIKNKILSFIPANNPISAKKIAVHCKLDIDLTKNILIEMWKKDYTVKPPEMAGNPEYMDDCTWWKL